MKPIASFPAIAAVAALSLMHSPAQSYSSRAWSIAQQAQSAREKAYRDKDEGDEIAAQNPQPHPLLTSSTSLAILQSSLSRGAAPARIDSYQHHTSQQALDSEKLRGKLLDIHA